MVGTEGIAPSASSMSGRRSAAELRPRKWCSRLGSHQRPPPSDDGALLTVLQERIGKIGNYWSGRPDSRRRSPAPHAGALAATLRPDSNGGRDGTRTHFFHRDRVDSRLFEFTPRNWLPELESHQVLAHGQSTASKAVELLLFDPGMVGRQGLAP